jgi:glycosyltransferase involved in cell wall biosynthesis
MLLPFAGVRPVHSVTLGIDTAIYQPRGVFPGQSSRPEILVVGRFDPVKGHAKLMSIFRGVLAAWPHNVLRPRLHILGEEANLTMADLEAAAREHSLSPEDCVISCRRHPNIAEAMTAATIGCVPSLGSEIICRVAEEFLLCGTPVAVSGVGSLDEVLFPTAGMSYRALDHATATQRLYELLWNAWHETPTMRAQRAAEARARFSLEAMADNLGASHLF